MSQTTRNLIESLKEGAGEAAKAIGSHLIDRIKDMPSEIAHEGQRVGMQGAAEIAAALFNGNGFVPYGQGQMRDQEKDGNEGAEQQKEQQKEQERGGMER